jgi:hypothetical protein
LTGFVAADGFVDDVKAATAPNNAIVAMALAQRLDRVLDLHDRLDWFDMRK